MEDNNNHKEGKKRIRCRRKNLKFFLGICGRIFLTLLIANIFFIDISWWIVFIPVFIPIILIMREFGK